MLTVLRIFSLVSIILGVFWGTYALANGFRVVGGDPFYFIPQAAGFIVLGAAGWAVFGVLARILGRLEKLEKAPWPDANGYTLAHEPTTPHHDSF